MVVISIWTSQTEAVQALRSALRYLFQRMGWAMPTRCKVMVVDDEPPLRKVLTTTLTARGFAVEEAGSAERALELVGQRPFDLILLDINMPGMGGVEACRRLRALMPQVGIVMVTVRDAEEDMVQALEAGADDYITKP